jgi:hypothetical protein
MYEHERFLFDRKPQLEKTELHRRYNIAEIPSSVLLARYLMVNRDFRTAAPTFFEEATTVMMSESRELETIRFLVQEMQCDLQRNLNIRLQIVVTTIAGFCGGEIELDRYYCDSEHLLSPLHVAVLSCTWPAVFDQLGKLGADFFTGRDTVMFLTPYEMAVGILKRKVSGMFYHDRIGEVVKVMEKYRKK